MYGYPGMPRFPYGRNPVVIYRRARDEVPVFKARPALKLIRGGRP